jgi:hypothetical protein
MQLMKYFTAAIATAALGLALVGCSSDNKSSTTSTSAGTSTSTSTASSSTPGAQPHKTIDDYINENHITDIDVREGDPGSPTINLPVPDGWKTSENANASFGIVQAQPANPSDPPIIMGNVHKLTGNVDPAKILEYAPGALQNLPGYEGSDSGPSTLSNFQAWQVSGTYLKDGTKRAAAQKTVVIPTQGAVFVLMLDADSLESDQGPLLDATKVIDDHTTITL